MTLDNPIVILDQVQLAENLGGVARVMKNFSFSNLRLVNPKINPLDPKAIATSVGADEILKNAEIYTDFSKALFDCHRILATTASPRDIVKEYILPRDLSQHIDKSQRIGIVFGCERTGLDNNQLSLASHLIHIPVNNDFSSLNLVQAVGIVLYELTSHQKSPGFLTGESSISSFSEVHYFLKKLESELDDVNFWRVPSKKTVMFRNLTNIFTRRSLTSQEIRTLIGMIESLKRGQGCA